MSTGKPYKIPGGQPRIDKLPVDSPEAKEAKRKLHIALKAKEEKKKALK